MAKTPDPTDKWLDELVAGKAREEQAVYLVLGITLGEHKELLGLWIGENEVAKFWLSVITELKNRGVQRASRTRMHSSAIARCHGRVSPGQCRRQVQAKTSASEWSTSRGA